MNLSRIFFMAEAVYCFKRSLCKQRNAVEVRDSLFGLKAAAVCGKLAA
jgi:hypothetical protein